MRSLLNDDPEFYYKSDAAGVTGWCWLNDLVGEVEVLFELSLRCISNELSKVSGSHAVRFRLSGRRHFLAKATGIRLRPLHCKGMVIMLADDGCRSGSGWLHRL